MTEKSLASQPLAIVIRLMDVTISRDELQSGLGSSLDRYEPTKSGSKYYAQVDVPDLEDLWAAALAKIQAITPGVRQLTAEGSVGSVSLDVGFSLPDAVMAKFTMIPADIVEAAGRLGMNIEISIYRSIS